MARGSKAVGQQLSSAVRSWVASCLSIQNDEKYPRQCRVPQTARNGKTPFLEMRHAELFAQWRGEVAPPAQIPCSLVKGVSKISKRIAYSAMVFVGFSATGAITLLSETVRRSPVRVSLIDTGLSGMLRSIPM